VTAPGMSGKPVPSETIPVLVVSDDDRVCEEISYGSPSHVRAEIARDSRAAWTKLEQLSPAVAVVDLQTGSAGGYGLARDMRADRRFSDTPILMLLERDQDAWLAEQAGATVWRTKPIDVSELIREVLALAANRPTADPPQP
jgi:DNA-binding response OmpR family regulator